jgi:cytochrome oxidase Cu insertion factor (SCO1/SenC/PrrC family)
MAPARERPGPAVAALAVILAVTAAWWALALYPAGASAPEWLVRTRLACFGAAPGALPNGGGWVLLVGEPLGMAAILMAGWRQALVRDLRLLASRGWGVALLAGVGVSLAWGGMAAAGVVRRAGAASGDLAAFDTGTPVRLDVEAPPLRLVDQHGDTFDLAGHRGRPLIVTFAFAHCEIVCPTVVQQVVRARLDAGRTDIALAVITLDPWRDVPARLPSIATRWELPPGDHVLSGPVAEVNRTLSAWGAGRSRDATTGEIDHAVAVLLVGRDGRLRYRLNGSAGWLRALLRDM